MELFKKKDEKRDNSILQLKPGTPIEISQISDKNLLYSHNTRLEEFLSEKEATILAPMSGGNIIRLSHNQKYIIIFKTNKGIFKNTMRVVSYDFNDNIPLIKIELLEENEKFQRRASFRLEIGLDFDFDVVEDTSEETLKNAEILLSKGKTADISSGGIKFFSNEDIEEGQYIKILINNEKLFIVAIGIIIHKEKLKAKEEYKFSYKCRFENIPKRYAEDLSKYIFDIQRELSKKGVIFNK